MIVAPGKISESNTARGRLSSKHNALAVGARQWKEAALSAAASCEAKKCNCRIQPACTHGHNYEERILKSWVSHGDKVRRSAPAAKPRRGQLYNQRGHQEHRRLDSAGAFPVFIIQMYSQPNPNIRRKHVWFGTRFGEIWSSLDVTVALRCARRIANWFAYQCVGCAIRMNLPSHITNNSTFGLFR